MRDDAAGWYSPVMKSWWPCGVAATLLALVVGGAALVVRPVWHDELYTAELARRTVPQIVDALRVDSGPPGHYLICRALHVVGVDDIRGYRVASWLAAAAAAGMLAAFAARRWGRQTGLIAAAMAGTHPLMMLVAAEARAYGILVLLSVSVAVLLAEPVSRRRSALMAAVLAAACWIHALGLVLCGLVVAAGAFLDVASRRRSWLAAAAALALHLPWVPVMAVQPARSLAWMDGVVRDAPSAVCVPLAVAVPAVDLSTWLDVAGWPAVVSVVAAALGAVAMVAGLASRSERPLAVMWILGSVVLVSATIVARPLYFPGRTDVVWLGPALLLAAALADRRRRWGAMVAGAVCVVGLITATRTVVGWTTAPPSPEREAARAVERLARSGDTVVTTGWWRLGVRHALPDRGEAYRWLTFPPDVERHPGWYDDAEAGPTAVGDLLDRVRERGAYGRVWLLRSPALSSDRLLDPVVGVLGVVPRASRQPAWELWGPPKNEPMR